MRFEAKFYPKVYLLRFKITKTRLVGFSWLFNSAFNDVNLLMCQYTVFQKKHPLILLAIS